MKNRIWAALFSLFIIFSFLLFSENSFGTCNGSVTETCTSTSEVLYKDGSSCTNWSCVQTDECGHKTTWAAYSTDGSSFIVGTCPASDLDIVSYTDPGTPVLQSGNPIYVSLFKNVGTLTAQTVYQLVKTSSNTNVLSQLSTTQGTALQTGLSVAKLNGSFTLTDLNTNKAATYSATLAQHQISVGGNIFTITATGLLADSTGAIVGKISTATPPAQAQIAAIIDSVISVEPFAVTNTSPLTTIPAPLQQSTLQLLQ